MAEGVDERVVNKNDKMSYQRIRFGRKTDEITKSVTVDEKTKFAFLDEKWTKIFQFLTD